MIASANHGRELAKIAAEKGPWGVVGAAIGAVIVGTQWRPEAEGEACSRFISMTTTQAGWVMTCLDEAGRTFTRIVGAESVFGPWIIGGFIGIFAGVLLQSILTGRSGQA